MGKRAKTKVPTATHIIEYTQKETGTKQLVGKVASELSSVNYGPEEWWLLLEPVPQGSSRAGLFGFGGNHLCGVLCERCFVREVFCLRICN